VAGLVTVEEVLELMGSAADYAYADSQLVEVSAAVEVVMQLIERYEHALAIIDGVGVVGAKEVRGPE
jgi:hypothetical protein